MTTVDNKQNDCARHRNQLLEALRRCSSDEQPLYGRDKEWTHLIKAYRHCTSRPGASRANTQQNQQLRKRLVLIRGSAGVGKSTLARKLMHETKVDDGWFISGKFDMLQQAMPYSGFIQALSEFARLLTIERGDDDSENDDKLNLLRLAVAQNVRNLEILMSVIPDLALLGFEEGGGKSSATTDKVVQRGDENDRKADGRAVRTRFLTTFRNFLRAIGSLGYPLVLLLDDIHWAGGCSLELLGSLLDDSQIQNVLFVCTSQTSAPSLEKYGPAVKTDVVLSNLSEVGTQQLLLDIGSLSSHDDFYATSSERLYQVTKGHCAFLRQVLLYEEECNGSSRNAGGRKKSLETTALSSGDEVVRTIEDVVRRRVSLLSKNLQDVLLYAAFLGYDIHGDLLSMVLRVETVERYLKEAERYGMVRYVPERKCHKFCHDSIQTGLLSTLPKEKRKSRHLAIGRQLLKSIQEPDLEDSIFVILDQIRRGGELITDQRERLAVATLCVMAGNRAVATSSFHMAAVYLEFGIRLMTTSWGQHYDLNLQLHNSCCEVQFALGEYDRAWEILSEVTKYARSMQDEMRPRLMRVYILGATSDMKQALDLSFETLRQIGHPIPSNPNKFHVLRLLRKVQKLLRSKSDEFMMRISTMQDRQKLACMQIMNVMLVSSFHSKKRDLLPYLTLRMIQISVEDGICSVSPFAFAGYGAMLIALREFDEGRRFAKLALALLERIDAVEYSARVYAIVYGLTFQWSVEYVHMIEPLRHGVKVGMETGDTEYATINGWYLITTSFNNGASLPNLCRTILFVLDLVKGRGYYFGALHIIKPFYQMVKKLMEPCPNSSTLTGDVVDGEALVQKLQGMGNSSVHLWVRYMMCVLAYLFGDFERAGLYGLESMELLVKQRRGEVNLSMVALFNGLAALAVYTKKPVSDRRTRERYLVSARRSLRYLRFICRQVPQNVLNRLKLLEAEYLAVTGKHEKAVEGFAIACALSADNGFTLGSAIGHERWARYLMARKIGQHEDQVRRAVEAYRRWGALAKVEHLMKEFPTLGEGKTRARASFYLPEQAV